MNHYNIAFTVSAFNDYEYWQNHDKKLLKKINSLIKSIKRDGIVEGEGKPEPLKENFSGYYSRRINREHRLVYTVEEQAIIIVSCRYHY